MASRIMHLAIGKLLEENIDLKDVDRFRIGQILPDAIEYNANVPLPTNFKHERINQICPFDLDSFLTEMQGDFSDHSCDEPKLLLRVMLIAT